MQWNENKNRTTRHSSAGVKEKNIAKYSSEEVCVCKWQMRE